MTHSEIETIVERYGSRESAILSILQDIQAKEKYLPREALEHLGEKLGIPINKIYRIATFYRALSLMPRGRHEVCVCVGTACHVRGAQRIIDHMNLEIGIRPGGSNQDR